MKTACVGNINHTSDDKSFHETGLTPSDLALSNQFDHEPRSVRRFS